MSLPQICNIGYRETEIIGAVRKTTCDKLWGKITAIYNRYVVIITIIMFVKGVD